MTENALKTLNDALFLLDVSSVDYCCKINGLALDSRKVTKGDLFLAVPGVAGDGRHYLAQAQQRGAAAVLFEREGFSADSLPELKIPVIPVSGLKGKLGQLISTYYSPTGKPVSITGYTGTNGKTSCCWFMAQLMARLGVPCAMMGTIGKGLPGALESTLNTTSDVLSTHQFIAGLPERGCHALAMEVSSHGLEQGRVDGVAFEVAVFTNLSRDHMDSYASVDQYARAKSLLFSDQAIKHAVINHNDAYTDMMLAACPKHVNALTWSLSDASADVYARDIILLPESIKVVVHSPWGDYPLEAPLLGRFNLENLLAVITALGVQGVDVGQVIRQVPNLTTVPGRVQRFGGGQQPLVLVDYAHTPDALGSVLSTLREHGARQLTCVFGCGGDRDRGKRPLMTRAALSRADKVILTSDNPRTESPETIIADALAGLTAEQRQHITVIVDRADAIRKTIQGASARDIVVIAGKGHETYQEVNGVRQPFDDREHVQQALAYRSNQ